MKNKVSVIYSIFAVLIYVVSVFYLCYSLVTEYQISGFISKEAFFSYGKTSFLIILAVTVVSLIMIVIESQEKEVSTVSEASDTNTDNSENEESEEELEELSATEEDSKEEESVSEAKPEFEAVVTDGIHNSIANEQEYAVIILKIKGIEKESEDWKKLTDLVHESFDSNDKIYERGENCIAILKPKTSLDENLILTENTISKIENSFAETKPSCYAGISNRNLRMVTADRLLFEAKAALEHAEQTEEKVIAFRANTQAYNDFMNQKA